MLATGATSSRQTTKSASATGAMLFTVVNVTKWTSARIAPRSFVATAQL